MDDLISRSDAIGAVKEERFPIDSDYAEGFMAALDKVEWILKEWLPSTQPEPTRILETRAIPSDDDRVSLSETVTATYYDEEKEEWSRKIVTVRDVLDSVCDEYTILPSSQPGRYKWNPIKDGLPPEEGVYFVTDDAGGMATVYLDVFSHYEDGSPYWLYSQNVTAWMHTPEPWKGEER